MKALTARDRAEAAAAIRNLRRDTKGRTRARRVAGAVGGIMGPEKLEKVLERMAVTDNATLVCEKAPDGKVRVTSSAWPDERVILKDQVLEVRNVDGRLHVARKRRQHDEWDPPIAPYDPYGPGWEVIDAE
jgi:hypothetical protein